MVYGGGPAFCHGCEQLRRKQRGRHCTGVQGKFAELLGEVVVADTQANLKARVEAEYGATEGKLKIAKRAKELGLDAIHDTVHEMCKDEARHGKAFLGLLERHFTK